MQGQTGSYLLTTLLVRPASLCLTTLANVRDELGIKESDNTKDARLTRFIKEESANIARLCNRVFGMATWQTEFRPQIGVRGEGVRAANNPLMLNRWPLTSPAVSFTGNTHGNLLVDGLSSNVGLYQGMLAFGANIPAGATISNVMPTSIMLSAAASGTSTGASLTAGLSVVETVAGVSTALVQGVDYQVETGSLLPGDEGVSRLYRLNECGQCRTWSATKIVVVYQAGYVMPGQECESPTLPRLPSDLETACIRLVVWRFNAQNRDPTLVEQSQGTVGTQRYWVGSVPGQRGPYPNEIMSVIESYRVPVIG